MVKFLLDAGADQEHKTDEMHTALMEASMVSITNLILSHPEAHPWWVKLSDVRQSKITKGTVLAGLGEKRLR